VSDGVSAGSAFRISTRESEVHSRPSSVRGERTTQRTAYLTQAKLAQALQQLVPDGWLGHEVAVAGSRHRWDMAYQRGGNITVVEYDGDEHYRHSLDQG